MKKSILINFVIILVLALFGFIISLYYSRLGFMPLDNSIIFDGGWRILSGQIPFRDFSTPSGIIPIILQALFFRIFGVTWFAYCLHAAVFNSLFCLLVYVLLRSFRGGRLLSLFYAFLSGIMFYPPIGTPYVDQHGLFFTLLSIVIAVSAITVKADWAKAFLWFILPIMLMVSYFSKQVPTIFAFPVILLLIVFTRKKLNLLQVFRQVAYGTTCAVGSLFLAVKAYSPSFEQIQLYFFKLPTQTAAERFQEIDLPTLIRLPFNTIDQYGSWLLISPIVIYLISFLVVIVYMMNHLKHRTNTDNIRNIPLKLFIGVSLILVCSLFIQITHNQKQESLGYVFAAFGLIHIATLDVIALFPMYPRLLRKRKPAMLLVTVVFMFISLRDAYLFNLNVNETRTVNDMVFSLESYNNKSHLPKELDFMVFQLPEDRNKYNDIDLMNLSDYLKNTPGNFYLIGDTSILYGITNKPSVSPTLWFHPGLTIPDETSDDFIIYEKQLQNNISKFKVRFVVLEGNCTFMGSDLSNFRQLYLRLTTSACPPISFGPFLVFELCR